MRWFLQRPEVQKAKVRLVEVEFEGATQRLPVKGWAKDDDDDGDVVMIAREIELLLFQSSLHIFIHNNCATVQWYRYKEHLYKEGASSQ